MGAEKSIAIEISETSGVDRIDEPISRGIYLEKGFLYDKDKAGLFDKRKFVPIQTEVLSSWSDGSIKWMLVDFRSSVRANSKKRFYLKNLDKRSSQNKKGKIVNDLVENLDIYAIGKDGEKYSAEFYDISAETKGELRSTMKYTGKFRNGKNILFDLVLRLSFFHGTKIVKMDLTVVNPRAAEHEGGFWDLGDKGSVFFKDLSVETGLSSDCKVSYKEIMKGKIKKADNVVIYQDSSGNENWKSRNHVDKDGKITVSFKGYKVFSDSKEVGKGDHAQPTVFIEGKSALSVSVKDFWQNFPKSIEAEGNSIIVRLFPRQADHLYELQAGEQKTHTIYLDLEGNDLCWIQEPLLVVQENVSAVSDKRYQSLVDNAIKGKSSFDKKNKIIDEFGWRNFGDIYADHESELPDNMNAVSSGKGMDENSSGLLDGVIISHYNNQYDVINGALLQFFRSNDIRWWKIADDLAKHVRDIDIYHTCLDKSAYNGGMFWHTFHYMDAATCTHRSYSKKGAGVMGKFNYGTGGGPSNEHNYATGLMNHFFLTGDMLSKKAVLSLADWVIDMDDGSKSVFRYLNHRPTGKASQSESIYYHGPGRGSGNSVNVLLDGFEISGSKRYLRKAEELIRRCIHPREDISDNDLDDVEHRWFYLVFLQALGRYLDIRREMGNLDKMFYYAKESLLHYAKWMIKNEVPFKDVSDKVDIPSETWSAQDIRKSIVLDHAFNYSGKDLFKLKSDHFFERCINDINIFKTKTFTRPIAILMHYSAVRDKVRSEGVFVFPEKRFDFGKPIRFKPQGYLIFKARDILRRIF